MDWFAKLLGHLAEFLEREAGHVCIGFALLAFGAAAGKFAPDHAKEIVTVGLTTIALSIKGTMRAKS